MLCVGRAVIQHDSDSDEAYGFEPSTARRKKTLRRVTFPPENGLSVTQQEIYGECVRRFKDCLPPPPAPLALCESPPLLRRCSSTRARPIYSSTRTSRSSRRNPVRRTVSFAESPTVHPYPAETVSEAETEIATDYSGLGSVAHSPHHSAIYTELRSATHPSHRTKLQTTSSGSISHSPLQSTTFSSLHHSFRTDVSRSATEPTLQQLASSSVVDPSVQFEYNSNQQSEDQSAPHSVSNSAPLPPVEFRDPPPCYSVAVKRARSFSAARGAGCPPIEGTTSLGSKFSTSTSDLYVVPASLKATSHALSASRERLSSSVSKNNNRRLSNELNANANNMSATFQADLKSGHLKRLTALDLDSSSPSNCSRFTNANVRVSRTEGSDNDSAFSDSVSHISNESSTSISSIAPLSRNSQVLTGDSSKAEKIKLALQKMREASVKKIFVKIFGQDGSAKSLLIDESMRSSNVIRILSEKNRVKLSSNWAVVENLPHLYMERVYEEHEFMVENLMLWTRDSKNKLFFAERPERSLLFRRPEILHPDYNSSMMVDDDVTQSTLVQQYLDGGLPTIEGFLHIKLESKKGWKKYHCVLRTSGIYYYKDKLSKSSNDLICLTTVDVNQVYYGFGWKKKFKSPTDHCFAIKHPRLQDSKSTKFIKYFCADDVLSLHKWVTAIRIIKYGRKLLENYKSSECHEDSELSDSGSSGCDLTFEADQQYGLTKHKPPKLPLSGTTRHLAASLDMRNSCCEEEQIVSLEKTPSISSFPPPPPEFLNGSLDFDENLNENMILNENARLRNSIENTNSNEDERFNDVRENMSSLTLNENIKFVRANENAIFVNFNENLNSLTLKENAKFTYSNENEKLVHTSNEIEVLQNLNENERLVNYGEKKSFPNLINNARFNENESVANLTDKNQRFVNTRNGEENSQIFNENNKFLNSNENESFRISNDNEDDFQNISENDIANLPPPPPRFLEPSRKDFMQDLHKVMRRNWQVAQKCKFDLETNPHEILGFRDEIPKGSSEIAEGLSGIRKNYREKNVVNWVEEHYGLQNMYENVYRPDSNACGTVRSNHKMIVTPKIPCFSPIYDSAYYPTQKHTYSKISQSTDDGNNNNKNCVHLERKDGFIINNSLPKNNQNCNYEKENSTYSTVSALKKRPPPPPPRRSETTQLTTTRFFKF